MQEILRDNDDTFRIGLYLHITSSVITTYMLKTNKSIPFLANVDCFWQVYIRYIIERYSSEGIFPIFNIKILLNIGQNSPQFLMFL